MLDACFCATMILGPPRVAISAMLELRAMLTAMGFDRAASPVGRRSVPMKALLPPPSQLELTICPNTRLPTWLPRRLTGLAPVGQSDPYTQRRDWVRCSVCDQPCAPFARFGFLSTLIHHATR